MSGETKKTDASSTTSASSTALTPGQQKAADQFKAALTAAKGLGSSTGTGAVYTKQEGDAVVQNVYQSLLGRNAVGNDYAKALAVYMAQSGDTGPAGRQQAIMNYVQNTPEYAARQDNVYLDAIYKEIAADVARTQVTRG